MDVNIAGFREWKRAYFGERSLMTHAEAFANLQRELSAQPDVVPEGWFTSEQWAEKTGVSEQHTRSTIRKAMAGGKMERSKFRIPSGGRFVSQPHYRIK